MTWIINSLATLALPWSLFMLGALRFIVLIIMRKFSWCVLVVSVLSSFIALSFCNV